MDRPALKRLLMDVRSGRINIIVVYKIDRLTRSLADFAKIVEVLDAAGASFVSVTQAFNTTTSMGRLTLNVLLSFAQFEREVTLASGTPGEQRAVMLQWIERITVEDNCIRLQLSTADFAWEDACPSIEARLVRRGKEVRLAFAPHAGGDRFQDASLIKLVVKANAARQALDRAEHHTLAELASEQGYTRDYFAVLLRLSYLAPDITAAILDGRQPVPLNRQRLARAANLPLEWQAQREMLGFA